MYDLKKGFKTDLTLKWHIGVLHNPYKNSLFELVKKDLLKKYPATPYLDTLIIIALNRIL